jgi:aryl-alcohol dehydrogenase-like predicted oxidoreductase
VSIDRRQLLQSAAGLALAGTAGARADALIEKPIPGSGETVPAVGLGTNRYRVGSEAENTALGDTLQVFADNGGRLIDTAPMYRSSETILGQLIRTRALRDELFIATKSDRAADDGGRERLENSFRQLDADPLDLVQSHNLRGVDSMLPVLREQQAEGRIRYLGITTSRNAQFPEFLGVMRREPLDFIQVNYSLADREAASEILPLAAERKIAVLVNLPLGRGRLFGAVEGLTLPGWTADFGCESWAQFFLKYVISHPAVTCAIPGMTKARHAVDNLGALRGRLPDASERQRMEAWFDAL